MNTMISVSSAFHSTSLISKAGNICRSAALHVASIPRSTNMSTSEEFIQRKTLKPLVVCGPSGVGKGTIISRFMDEFGGSERFGFTVSHTTRKPRPGEIDGIHYNFIDESTMKEDIENGKFLEWANVHGNFYGTSLKSLSSSDKYPLLDIDVQGVKSIKKWQEQHKYTSQPSLNAKFVFIAPPSLDILKKRLLGRGTETSESITKRTENAIQEVQYGLSEGNFDAIIVNDDLDRACEEFNKVIKDLYQN